MQTSTEPIRSSIGSLGVEEAARALAYYMGQIENIEAHHENKKMFPGLFGWEKNAA